MFSFGKPPFLHFLFSNPQEKGMGFLDFKCYFLDSVSCYVGLSFEGFEHGFDYNVGFD